MKLQEFYDKHWADAKCPQRLDDGYWLYVENTAEGDDSNLIPLTEEDFDKVKDTIQTLDHITDLRWKPEALEVCSGGYSGQVTMELYSVKEGEMILISEVTI
jgi:hypothetical protein